MTSPNEKLELWMLEHSPGKAGFQLPQAKREVK